MNEEHNKTEPTVLFAAANSGRGFANFYDRIFERKEIEHRYLIKGGPGTGKSTFMRRIGEKAEAEGFKAEYYRCSSDPDSLDAVVLEGRIALMDATSPHSVDADLPGARDEIVDPGVFWDSGRLFDERERIAELSARKSECYRAAYRYLSAAMALDGRSREIVAPYVKREKMRRAVRRLAQKIPDGEGFELLTGLCSSVGMKGRVRLDTYEKRAEKLYLIEDRYKCGGIFLSMLIEEAMRKGNKVRVSYYPIDPSYPDAVAFEESGTVFVLCERADNGAEGESVNLRRFLDMSSSGLGGAEGKRLKKEYKDSERLIDGLVQSAVDRLRDAGGYHFELEEIYKARMDFEALEAFTNSFAEMIIAKLKYKR